jgi:hypothetical protein
MYYFAGSEASYFDTIKLVLLQEPVPELTQPQIDEVCCFGLLK